MSLKHKYVPTCMSKSLRMVWILLFLLLHEVKLVCTDKSITITSSTCGDYYRGDYYKSFKVEHYGSNVLNADPCSVEFTKTSTDQYLCVSGDEIKLDCGTTLEYHKGFVKNYIPPEKSFSCNSVSLQEWCPSQYQDNIYIVIRKTAQYNSDIIKLRVYLKDVQDLGFTVRIVLYSLIPIVVVVIIIVVAICARMRAVKACRGHPQVAYQTTSGTVNTQAGQGYGSPYPTTACYQPVQQGGPQQLPELQGNYNIHPVQTAYPVQQGPTPAQNITTGTSSYGQHYPSEPTLNTAAAASPPSYESVVGTKL